LSPKFATPSRSKRQLLTVAALRAAALSFSGLPIPSQSAVETDFSFALIGDTPYTTLDELSGAKVIQEASTGASFTIHVGDIKNGVAPCTDELLTRRIKFLDASPIPLMNGLIAALLKRLLLIRSIDCNSSVNSPLAVPKAWA
jgi:hypothetical protein